MAPLNVFNSGFNSKSKVVDNVLCFCIFSQVLWSFERFLCLLTRCTFYKVRMFEWALFVGLRALVDGLIDGDCSNCALGP